MILKSIITIILNAAVTNKIYPVIIPQDITLPACKLFVVGDKPNPAKQEISQLNEFKIQISSFAKTYNEAVTLDNSIKAVLDGYRGEIEGMNIKILHANSFDLFEDSTRVYHRATDYTIFKK